MANSDAPTADVPLGASEYVSYITAFAGLLNGYLGHDYGLSKNAQSMSLLISGLVVLGTSISRAIKHHGAMHANAMVYANQLAHVAAVVTANGGPGDVAAVAAGVSALNTAVENDSGGGV